MHSIIIFICSSLASFIGSVQLGPVNLFVIDTAIKRNEKVAVWVAIGGIIPEFIYCFLAVYSGSYFMSNPIVFLVFRVILIVVLFLVGVIYMFKKHKILNIETEQVSVKLSKTKHFFKGFILAFFNPQLMPFWIFVMVYFNSIYFLELKSDADRFAYILGAGFGALLLLTIIILTVNKFKAKLLFYLNNKYYFKVLGLLFIAISLQQLVTLF